MNPQSVAVKTWGSSLSSRNACSDEKNCIIIDFGRETIVV
jgi:hypothetical protein